MAVYVCSDIHGRYDRYLKLLDTLKLGVSDKLYILGDVVDRGDNGVSILLDIIKRPNVELLLGNHEYMMLFAISDMLEGKASSPMINLWLDERNGGRVTLTDFVNLSSNEQGILYGYLSGLSLIRVINVNGRLFHLSHSYTLPKLEKDTYNIVDVSGKELYDIVWKSPFRSDRLNVGLDNYRKELTYIVGHVPVQSLNRGMKISNYNNIYDVDCGCALGTKKDNCLGCLRLDDMKGFYVI